MCKSIIQLFEYGAYKMFISSGSDQVIHKVKIHHLEQKNNN